MTAAALAIDVLAVSAQLACVIAMAAVLAQVVRIDAAAVRYQYWRALLLLCLVLPWIQRRQATASTVETIATIAFPTSAVVIAPATGVSAPAPGIPWIAVALWIVLAGITIRLARLGYGIVRLRGIRRSGRLAPASCEHDGLQRELGTQAEIRYVSHGHPVTCGVWRPVVLLPEGLTSHPPEIQHAVLAHELLHVKRRDWLWVIGEEVLRSVLWFHPGIWWLVGRVRLAREEVVDELTICVTGRRRTYLEALLAFADAAPFAPGAAFARRRHLFRRMTLISKEAVMSSKRIAWSCAVLVFGVIAGSWSAVKAFPLAQQAPGIVAPAAQPQSGDAGPLERSTKAITPENPIPRRTYSVMPPYPDGAEDANAVVITLRVTINSNGRAGEVRATGRVSLSGDVQFAAERVKIERAQRNAEIQAARDRGVIIADSATISPFSSSDVFIKSAIDAVRQWVFEPPADAPISFDVTLLFARGAETRLVAYGGPLGIVGGVESRPREQGTGAAGDAAPPPPPPAPVAPWTREGATIANPVRIGGAILPPVKTKDVRPEYSPIAMSSHAEGVVILEAVIGPEGRVDRVSVLRSIPLLDQSAMDAVKEWEFTPTLMNGTPVPVIMTVSINFTLK